MKTDRGEIMYGVFLVLVMLMAVAMIPAYGSRDVDQFWLRWISDAEAYGLVRGYAISTLDYPPLSVALLWLFARVGTLAGVGVHLGLKLGIFVFLNITVGLFLGLTRNIRLTAILAAGLLVKPVCLAYVDVLFMPPLVLAFWCFAKRRPVPGLLAFTLSCLVKYQPLIVAPFIVAHLLETKSLSLRAVVVSAIPVGLTMLIYGGEVLVTLGRALNHLYLSAYAFNLNWIVTRVVEHTGLSELLAMKYGIVFLSQAISVVTKLAFMGFYIHLLAARKRGDFADVIKAATVACIAYFVLCTGVHENHLVLAVPAAALAAVLDSRWAGRAMLIGAYSSLNMLYVYGVDGSGGLMGSGLWLDVVLSAALVSWFVFLVRPYVLSRRSAQSV